MEKRKLSKRIISFILVLMLIIPMLPIGVLADESSKRSYSKKEVDIVENLEVNDSKDDKGSLEILNIKEEDKSLIEKETSIYETSDSSNDDQSVEILNQDKDLKNVSNEEETDYKKVDEFDKSEESIDEKYLEEINQEKKIYDNLEEDLEVVEEKFYNRSHKLTLSEINKNENLKFNLEYIVWYWTGDQEITEDVIKSFMSKNKGDYSKIIDVYKDIKDIVKEVEKEKDFIGLSHKKVLGEINKNENLQFNLNYISWYWVMDLDIDEEIISLFEYNNPKNFKNLISVKKYLDDLKNFNTGNKKELKSIIDEIEALDLELYTEKTVNPLKQSLIEARLILSDERAGQVIIDNIVKELLHRKNKLEEKPVKVDLKRNEIEDWLDKKIDEISSIYTKNEKNGDWVIALLGKLDIKINQESIDGQIARIFDEDGNYNGENANELLKIILALRASGIDPENVYGVNLVEELIINKETRGFYYDSCGLWAINSDDYKIVEKYQDRVDSMVKRLLDVMEPGYVTSGFSKFDDTGFALLALAPYYNGQASGKYNGSKEVKRVVDKALNYISENQMGDGDFSNGGAWGAPNANTLEMLLMGITSIDPELIWDMKYVESGNTILSLLKEKYDIKDGFKWKENDKKANSIATEQGLRALINYKSMVEGTGLVFNYRGKDKVAIEKEITFKDELIDILSGNIVISFQNKEIGEYSFSGEDEAIKISLYDKDNVVNNVQGIEKLFITLNDRLSEHGIDNAFDHIIFLEHGEEFDTERYDYRDILEEILLTREDYDVSLGFSDGYEFEVEVLVEYIKSPQPEIDRTELDKVLGEAKTLKEESFTSETFNALKKALNLGEDNQEAIDFKVKAIEGALKNLKPLTDKSKLKKEISRADKLVDELSKMKKEGQKEFKEALVKAKLILDSDLASQKEVEDATKNLLNKRSKLSRKPITVKIRIETNDRTIFEEKEITFDHERVEPLFEKAGYDKLETSTYYRPIEAILLAVDKAGIDVSNPDEFDAGTNGSFITKIGKLEMNSLNASMDGWMYWVNNDYANLGVNAFEISDKDIIDLFFKEDYMQTKYSYFTETEKEVEAGEEFELELKFNHFNEDDVVDGAKILIDDIETDYVTDELGKVKIKIDNPGSYHISAEKKNEDGLRVITRPYARIKVKTDEKPYPELDRSELEKLTSRVEVIKSRNFTEDRLAKLNKMLALEETNQEEINKKVKEIEKELNELEKVLENVEDIRNKVEELNEINLDKYTEESSKELRQYLENYNKILEDDSIVNLNGQSLSFIPRMLDNLVSKLEKKTEIDLDKSELEKVLEYAKNYTEEEYGENTHNLELSLELSEKTQEEVDIKTSKIKEALKDLNNYRIYVEDEVSKVLEVYKNINLELYEEESATEFKEVLVDVLRESGEDNKELLKISEKTLREKLTKLENLYKNLKRKEDLIILKARRDDKSIIVDLENTTNKNLDNLKVYIGQYTKNDNRMLNLEILDVSILGKSTITREVEMEAIEETVIKVFVWDNLANTYSDVVEFDDQVEAGAVKPGNKTVKDYESRVKESIEKTAKVAIGTHHSMDWVALGLATSGNKNMIPGDYLDNVIAYLDENNGEFKNKPTEYERMAIGVLSAGGNPRNIGKYDLIEKVYNSKDLDKQGINAMAFGLIALDLRDYKIPEDALWSREKILDWIIEDECSNKGTEYNKPGGWAWGPMDKADVDMTAMVLTSLAPYNNEKHPQVQQVIKRGFDWLKYAQEDDGHYGSWGSKTSESSSQVIMAAAANGIDPAKEFEKNGKNVIDALLSFEVDTGGYAHMDTGGSLSVNGMATEQALYALSQLKSFIEGKGSIYRFSPELNYSIKGLENGEVTSNSIKDIEIISDAETKVLVNDIEVTGNQKYKINLKEGINEIVVIIAEGTIDEVIEKYKIYYEEESVSLDVESEIIEDKQLLTLKLENLQQLDLQLEVLIGQYDIDTNEMKNITTKDVFLSQGESIVEKVEIDLLDNTFIKIFTFDLDGNPYTDVITIK